MTALRAAATGNRMLVAVLMAGSLVLAGCSDDPAPVATPTSSAAAPASQTPETGDTAVAPAPTSDAAPAEETTDAAPGAETPESPDGEPAAGDGVCALLPVNLVGPMVAQDFTQATLIDSGTVPECLYTSTTGTTAASVGYLKGGAGELDEQQQILEMTSTDPVVTQEKVNGNDATLIVAKDLIGNATAKVIMAQKDDLITASFSGGKDDADLAKTQALLLANYFASVSVPLS